MGRRKKEPRDAHRAKIATAAHCLFQTKGIEAATMDDIAGAAGYSKATLYVYYKNKEEIISVLILESMKKLYAYLTAALERKKGTREIYFLLCYGLVEYQKEFPFYFKLALDKINVDLNEDCLPEERETFEVGEAINSKIIQFLTGGIEKGEIRPDVQPMPTIFAFWSMLSGFIQTAVNKEAYLKKEWGLSKQEFLDYGFDTLYRSIACSQAIQEKTEGRALLCSAIPQP